MISKAKLMTLEYIESSIRHKIEMAKKARAVILDFDPSYDLI